MDKIDQLFPMESYRPGQKEAIETILEAFETHDFVLLEAPTGSGKSPIAYTLMQFFNNSFYLAPAKFLQDQLTKDFAENGIHRGDLPPMIDLKGRNAYPCEFWKEAMKDPNYEYKSTSQEEKFLELSTQDIGCDAGECKRQKKAKLKYCMAIGICPYFNRLDLAKSSKICLMNYHSFLFQCLTTSFSRRDLLVLDEGHCAEDILMGFVEFTLSDRYFQAERISFPHFDTVAEYVTYFEEIKLRELMDYKRVVALSINNFRDYDEWVSRIRNYDYIVDSDPDNWVCQWEETKTGVSRKVSIKPIFVRDFATRYLFGMANKTLMMSATLFSKNVLCDSLGIDSDSAKFLRLPNLFPVKNRQIIYRPSGSMRYAEKKSTLPKMVTDVNKICQKHHNKRGIIHTHNFEIAFRLVNDCAKNVSSRFLFQKDTRFNNKKEKMLEEHKNSTNSILIAPALHEGLDLYDDLARFQLICKVPYPSMRDPQIAARMKLSQSFYDWRTMCKIVQSYGRTCRHDKDFCVTYVLDGDFKRFVEKCHGFPKWFLDAIRWY